MFWLFHAGFVAATRQLLAIIIVTLGFALLSRQGLVGPLIVSTTGDHVAVTPAVSWSYLLIAVNSALTKKEVLDATAARIRYASRRMGPTKPNRVIKRLSAYLWLAAVSQAVLTLLPAPTILLSASESLGSVAGLNPDSVKNPNYINAYWRTPSPPAVVCCCSR